MSGRLKHAENDIFLEDVELESGTRRGARGDEGGEHHSRGHKRKKRRDDCNKNMLLSIKFDILRIRKHSETSRYLQKKCENTGSFSCIFIVIKSKEKWL